MRRQVTTAILELANQRQTCRSEFVEIHERYGFHGIATILRAGNAALDAVYAELSNGEITFGEANKRFDQIIGKTGQAVQQYAQAMDARQEQIAEQRRIDAILLMQAWQSRPSPPPPPATVNCTSMVVGGTVRTTCR